MSGTVGREDRGQSGDPAPVGRDDRGQLDDPPPAGRHVRARPDGPRDGVRLLGTAVQSLALGALLAHTGAAAPLAVAVALLAAPAAMQVAGTVAVLVLQAVTPPAGPLPELEPGAEAAAVSRTAWCTPRSCTTSTTWMPWPRPCWTLALYRARRWNPVERCWMGWERKRGKLLEFADLVAGVGAGSFTEDPVALHGLRFAITVDLGDRLLPGGARRLVAAIAHPDNRAVVDPERGGWSPGSR